MELRAYLRVLLRRWYIVFAPPLLVLVFAVYQDLSRETNYTASARLSVVRQPGEPLPDTFEYDEYYNYQSSEFAIDDLVEIVRGNVFASNVSARLQEQGIAIDSNVVQDALTSDRKHRILTISATTTDAEQAVVIVGAAANEVLENTAAYLGHGQPESPSIVRPVQFPGGASPDTQRMRLLFLLGIFVTFGAGVLAAFVVDYLDDTLYDADTAAYAMELPHVATVPGDQS